jgi:hypothetical protein
MAGNDEGDDYRRPGVVIEECVLAKAPAAKHRVPIRNLKKTAPLRCRRGMDNAAYRLDDDLPLPVSMVKPQPSRPHRL